MYLFIDVETNGLPANYDAPPEVLQNWPRAVEIGWQLCRTGDHVDRSHGFIIRPTDWTIPDSVAEVHGITTQRAIRQGMNLELVLEVLLTDIQRASVIVAHNVAFDGPVLSAEYLRAGYWDALRGKRTRCTMEEGTAFCQIPNAAGTGFKWPRLTELHEALFGIKLGDDCHRAEADADACRRCFFKLIELEIIAA